MTDLDRLAVEIANAGIKHGLLRAECDALREELKTARRAAFERAAEIARAMDEQLDRGRPWYGRHIAAAILAEAEKDKP